MTNTGQFIGNLTIDDVAARCYRAERELLGPGTGDPATATPFAQLSDQRRDIIVAGINDVIADPAITPDVLHQRWVDRMKSQGWTRGGATNVSRLEHALLVPYHEVPPGDQLRTRLFLAIVRMLLVNVGQEEGQGQQAAAAGGKLRTER